MPAYTLGFKNAPPAARPSWPKPLNASGSVPDGPLIWEGGIEGTEAWVITESKSRCKRELQRLKHHRLGVPRAWRIKIRRRRVSLAWFEQERRKLPDHRNRIFLSASQAPPSWHPNLAEFFSD